MVSGASSRAANWASAQARHVLVWLTRHAPDIGATRPDPTGPESKTGSSKVPGPGPPEAPPPPGGIALEAEPASEPPRPRPAPPDDPAPRRSPRPRWVLELRDGAIVAATSAFITA